jgi:hypothetical protein
MAIALVTARPVIGQISDANQETQALPKATKQQISDWLSQHIVAWDENTKLTVDGNDCRLQIMRNNRSAIMNFNGILFPVEVIRKGNSNDAFVRVRFKERYSGDYGMERECNQQNNFCQDNIGKWSPLSYYDFTVTNVSKYSGPILDLNITKSNRLARALSHYARLCNATDYNFTF